MATASDRDRRVGRRGPLSAALGGLLTVTGLLAVIGAAVEAGQAGADSAPYELYCPGTPIGSIALNDVVTSGSITPSSPSAGSTFSLTNYQTTVNLPASLASAAAALGNTAITGSADITVDAAGATPASMAESSLSFDVPIPSSIPASGLTLAVPSAPATVGPFTATGGAITLSEDSSASLTLEVSGSPLTLTCTAYPNDAVPTGITNSAPSASPVSPVIATAGGSGGTTTTVSSGGTSSTTTTTQPQQASSGAYELYCPGTPVGNIALNDVTTTASLLPAAPTVGQQFNVVGYQTTVKLPQSIAQAAAALGNLDITGSATAKLDAQGATPASLATPAMSFDAPIPNPVPSSGMTLVIPSPPASVGPFTATGGAITIEEDAAVSLGLDVSGNTLQLDCHAYPNDTVATGITTSAPSGSTIDPVLVTSAAAGSGGGPTGTSAPYELYCPGTPVGDLVFNDVISTASLSPSTPSAGQQFQVDGYQIAVPLPAGLVSAAAGLSNSSFVGLGASNLDAYGASPSQVPTGPLAFAQPIPTTVPPGPLTLDLPATPTTVGPFTADGGPLAIAQDQTVLVVARLSDKAFKMQCTAYPNDSIPVSGSTGTAPPAEPIRPVITTGTATGTPVTTTPSRPQNPGPGKPYELYCPATPIGDIAIDDVLTTASITPSTLNEGDPFHVTGLQTTFTLPQAVAQEMEDVGLTSLRGSLNTFLQVTGAGYGAIYTGVASSGPVYVTGGGGPAYYYPGYGAMTFSVTLPSPVPATGVQFTATAPSGYPYQTFFAAGGPISVSIEGVNLFANAFGDQFGTFCQTLAAGSVPTGLAVHEPTQDLVRPTLATATATVVPPPPAPPGAYELYCPGTPVGTVVLNDVTSSGSLSPSEPASGTPFDLTGYQTRITIPPSIVSAAAALGNTAITGNAVTTLDAAGATPASLGSGPMSFDIPIPSPIPPGGVSFDVPASPTTVGPFTATGGDITISESGRIALSLIITGNALDLNCTAYPSDTLPSGITSQVPPVGPISPVIATTASMPPTTAPGAPTTSTPAGDPLGTQSSDSMPTGGAQTGPGGGSGGGTGTTPGTGNGVVTASSGSLAFTGSGPGLRRTAALGAVLLLAGLLLLLTTDVPKKVLRRLLQARR